MAVEMGKLSRSGWCRWTATKPFSFVDDKVLCGNSLLGITDLRQLEALHITPPTGHQQQRFEIDARGELVERLDLDHALARAVRLRQALTSEIDDADPQRSATAKARQWKSVLDETSDLSKVADGIVAAGLALGGKPGRALDDAYENLRVAVDAAYPSSGDGDPTMLDAIIERGLTPTVETDYERWQPLHWPLVVADVMRDGGFHAVIGNPPFLGGKKSLRRSAPICASGSSICLLAVQRVTPTSSPTSFSEDSPSSGRTARSVLSPQIALRKATPDKSGSTASSRRVGLPLPGPFRAGHGQPRAPTWSMPRCGAPSAGWPMTQNESPTTRSSGACRVC